MNRLIAVLVLLATVTLTACAHSRRMAEVNAFEAGYFQLLTLAAYEEAYDRLHAEVKARVTPEDYQTFYRVLTDTFGPLGSHEKVPGAHDQHIPLLERERRVDPLPPDKPDAALQSRHLVKFANGTATFLIRTGWENGRMVIRAQVLCCMDEKTMEAIRARANELGVGHLFAPKSETERAGQTDRDSLE